MIFARGAFTFRILSFFCSTHFRFFRLHSSFVSAQRLGATVNRLEQCAVSIGCDVTARRESKEKEIARRRSSHRCQYFISIGNEQTLTEFSGRGASGGGGSRALRSRRLTINLPIVIVLARRPVPTVVDTRTQIYGHFATDLRAPVSRRLVELFLGRARM